MEQKNTNKKRNSNLELFRIITMLLIVAHHYVVNSGLTAADGPIYASPISKESMFLLIYGAWGKTGINCFMLITGYFMCEKEITLKKFIKLLAEVMFYNIVISAIFWLSGAFAINIKDFVKTLLPVYSIEKNFTGCFLIFYLFIPFLNKLLKAINEKEYLRLLGVLSFTYILMGTIPGLDVTMNYVSWFMVIYLIGAYIKLYPRKFFDSAKIWGGITTAFIFIDILSVISCAYIGKMIGKNSAFYFVTDSNTFLAVATSISAFLFFKNINLKYNKFINTVASTTFGVLLIHANSDMMRQWLWKDALNNVGIYGTPQMYIHAVLSVIGIFAVCSVIDLVRIITIEKYTMKLVDKLFLKKSLSK